VLTTVKQNPLVEVALVSPKPGSERNCTILASWTYGLGRAVAFTSDAGARWTGRWTGWENYDKLFGQLVGWSMRPTGDEGNFAVATNSEEGKVRVVVTALDKNDEFLNFLDMTGTAIGPDLKPVDIKMEQIAPGRYVGTFPGRDAGSYFIMVSPGAGKAPIRTGINVPYSDEFRGRATNHALLGQLAESQPKGSDPPAPGRLTAALEDAASLEPLLAVDSFRHDLPRATSSQDIWYYLVLAACCLFFFDVFVRRVQISFTWVPVLAGRVRDTILRRQPQLVRVETIDRLRSRKAEVTSHIEQLRQSARFEPSPDVVADVELLEEPRKPPAPTPAKPSLAGEDSTGDDSYTARLLRAKKKAWEKRKD